MMRALPPALALLLESAHGAAALRRSMPVLADFATVEIAAHGADSDYPALGWDTAAAACALRRYVALPSWWRERLLAARYANVPLANLGADVALSAADTQVFGRI